MTDALRFRAALLVSVGLVGLGGCASPEPPAASPVEPTGTSAPSETPSPTPTVTLEEPISAETVIALSVNGAMVRGVLPTSAAASSLVDQLPLELSFVDFGGQEKIAPLPAPLPLDGMPSGSAATPGIIGYYAPDQALVLYYDAVGYYEGIIPIGTFDAVDIVRDSGPFTATITLEQ